MTKWSNDDRKTSKKKGKMSDDELKEYLLDGLAVLAKDWDATKRHPRPHRKC